MSEPSVTKADILNACKDMLCKELYVVFTTPTNGLGPVMANLEEHLQFQIGLEKKELCLALDHSLLIMSLIGMVKVW